MAGKKWRPLHMIAGIIALLGIVFVTISVSFDRITEQNISQEREAALQMHAVKQNEYAAEMLDSQFRILESIAEFIGTADEWKEQKRVFGIASQIAIETEEFWRLTMAREDGTSITSDLFEGSIAHREYFHKAVAGERTVSEPFTSDVEEGYICMMLAVPIHNKAGEITGVLGGSYKIEKFAELLLDSYNADNTYEYALLSDASGNILVASYYDQIDIYKGNIFERKGITHKDGSSEGTIRAAMEKQQIYTSHVMEGDTELYMTQTPFGYNNWTIFSIMDAKQVNQPYTFITENANMLNLLLGCAMCVCFALIFIILIWDRRITSAQKERIQAEKMQLALSEERYRLVAEDSQAMVFELNEPKKEIVVNDHFKKVLGADVSYEDFRRGGKVFPEDQELYLNALQKVYETKDNVEEEFRVMVADKESYFWCRMFLRCILDDAGGTNRVIGMISDIDAIKKEEERLRFKAQTDTMTGLTNKAATQELIIQKLSEARQEPDGILIVDMDGLKEINDTLGHFEGDRAIAAVAETLRNQFRETDIVGRIGGDEFMVYLNGAKGEAKLCNIAAALCRKVSEVRIGPDDDCPVTVSIGIVLVKPSDEDFFELYKKADEALYYVKRHEKRGYAVYNSQITKEFR